MLSGDMFVGYRTSHLLYMQLEVSLVIDVHVLLGKVANVLVG